MTPLTVCPRTALAVLGLSEHEFRTLVREENVPGSRVCRRTVYVTADVMAALERRRAKTAGHDVDGLLAKMGLRKVI